MDKTIAIDYVNLISDEVHPDSMELREADDEYCCTDGGEEICCPICGTARLTDIEGNIDVDSCVNLRSSLRCG
jgi:hypothetical protein